MEVDHLTVTCSFGPPLWLTLTIYAMPLVIWLAIVFRRRRFSLRGLFVLTAAYGAIAATWPPW